MVRACRAPPNPADLISDDELDQRRRAAIAVPARGLATGARLCRRLARGGPPALLVLFCLLAFLPGFFQIPPVDRDEARFAQATKQMIERGEYVDIQFQNEVRYKKPIGIYWLQAAAVKAGEALGVPEAHDHHLALSAAVAVRRDRRGAG